jgi:RimJ/RimL family protein N-acetyltransferase
MLPPSLDDRFLLRAPTLDDAASALAIHCDPRTNPFRPGGPPSEAEILSSLDTWLAHWATRRFGYWAAIERSTGIIAGFGGIMEKPVGLHHSGLNLYYRLAPEFWGCGLATHIGHSALKEAFQSQSATEVFARVLSTNLPSRRVLQRLRMTILASEPAAPDEYLIYSLPKSQYAPPEPLPFSG